MSSAEFNQCSGLVDMDKVEYLQDEYDSIQFGGGDTFQHLLDMQEDLQKVYTDKHGRCPAPSEVKTKGELIDSLLDMKLAFDDEFRELIEAVHGMSRPASERSAGWKKWKGDYDKIRAEGIDENLTADDIVERDMELIDMAHFFLNMMLLTKIDSEKLFVYYNLKNKENHDRQTKGY
jgi:hypothetical protein